MNPVSPYRGKQRSVTGLDALRSAWDSASPIERQAFRVWVLEQDLNNQGLKAVMPDVKKERP